MTNGRSGGLLWVQCFYESSAGLVTCQLEMNASIPQFYQKAQYTLGRPRAAGTPRPIAGSRDSPYSTSTLITVLAWIGSSRGLRAFSVGGAVSGLAQVFDCAPFCISSFSVARLVFDMLHLSSSNLNCQRRPPNNSIWSRIAAVGLL